ncbi:CpaF/VirB11 family protein [Peribacillus muralis]|uniref:CpaF/VirB11 family protein n=1 Tax=Peribacillus muralis TaxID=264697 RepID=UPI001F4DB232|nr:CpaF/VirB11 family protein [Peribacillus muralis]MCK1995460.1 CpaF/VirB11 family protein [Peribacillus muralis]MCK2016043.1 CpaF/VirB11 family protein [Peribacillus muralis]
MKKISEDILKDIIDDLKMINPELMLEAFTDPIARQALKKVMQQDLPKRHNVILRTEEHIDYALSEIVGLGVIEEIIKNPFVTDISYNGTELIIDTNNEKYVFEEDISENYIVKLIQKFANAVGKEFTPKNPILDAALNNLRINAVHKSQSPFGTTMALRSSKAEAVLNEGNFKNFAPEYMLEFFEAAIKSRSNIIIAGETGTGKTELQKFLVKDISFDEKIINLEDTVDNYLKELYLEKDIHSWVTSQSIGFTELIKAGLRNNPVWMLISETRGKEAYEMLQAVLSGHKIITTLHAVDARAIPKRFINMMKIGYMIDEESVLSDIYNYFQLGVHIEKTKINGQVVRYLSEVVEFRPDKTAITVFKQVKEGDEIIPIIGEMSEEFIQNLKKFGCETPTFGKETILDGKKEEIYA